jgi:hypothetical protein
MAVYATMIRDDPDSRARLRVTPSRRSTSPTTTAWRPASPAALAFPASSARPTDGHGHQTSGRTGTSNGCSNRSAPIPAFASSRSSTASTKSATRTS